MVEKSKQQALYIQMINSVVPKLDIEFLRNAGTDMKNVASRQEAMAVINPSHPQIKNDLLRQQGVSLHHLCAYVESLIKIDELKAAVSDDAEKSEEIKSLFI